jgi:hypothetical protein
VLRFIKSASTIKAQEHRDCAQNYNMLLKSMEPTNDQKHYIAELLDPAFPDHSEEKALIISNIECFRRINKVNPVRFRSFCQEIQSVLENRPLIKPCLTSPNTKIANWSEVLSSIGH